MSSIYAFISGMVALGSSVAAIFFIKFWKRTNDRFFLLFSLSFWLLAIERVVNAILHHYGEDHVAVYTLRFVAFVLIIVAIVDKNRSDQGAPK